MAEPERLPPPPFWRTLYYAQYVMGRPGRRIDPIEIRRTLEMPERRTRQADGRVRHWRWVAEHGHWLRVVTEADGETVHNAFWDRDFAP